MSVADALRFAERVERCCSRTCGRAIAGVILHGSLTLDDYIPGRSDVDILAVVERPLTDTQLDALVEAVAEERQHAPARLDLRVVTRSVASTPTPAPPMEIYTPQTPAPTTRGRDAFHRRSGSPPAVGNRARSNRRSTREAVIGQHASFGRMWPFLAGSFPKKQTGWPPD
jgi:hypothetical protein